MIDAVDSAIVLTNSTYFDATEDTSGHQVCLPFHGRRRKMFGQVRMVNKPLEVIAQGGEFRESDAEKVLGFQV